jgi:hypothetical protein
VGVVLLLFAIPFVAWGDKTGGYSGIEEGTDDFQNAEINPGWKLVGIAATVGIAGRRGARPHRRAGPGDGPASRRR